MEFFALVYLVLINAFAVAVCIFDKSRAKRGGYRVPEKTLLLISVIGGSVAMYITMKIIRHKTKHVKFMVGLPFIIVLQLILVVSLVFKY